MGANAGRGGGKRAGRNRGVILVEKKSVVIVAFGGGSGDFENQLAFLIGRESERLVELKVAVHKGKGDSGGGDVVVGNRAVVAGRTKGEDAGSESEGGGGVVDDFENLGNESAGERLEFGL